MATALRIELARHLASYDGITLLVTHDAIDALTLADRVLVIDDGRVAQVGTPAEVSRHAPATEHVARLVGLNVLRDRATVFRCLQRRRAVTVVADPSPSRVGPQPLAGPGRSASAPHGDAIRLPGRARDRRPELIADVTPAATRELGLESRAARCGCRSRRRR